MLRDKIDKQITEVAYQVIASIVTRQNQSNANQSGMGQVSSVFEEDGIRKAKVTDQYGKSRTITLTSSRIIGKGDAIILINGNLGL